jgi:outer membrane murein-binding lipoprotein Lpp
MDYSVEARIARLESDVSHLRTDVADIKTDLRSLRDRMDAKFDALMHAISRAQMWALMLYIAPPECSARWRAASAGSKQDAA